MSGLNMRRDSRRSALQFYGADAAKTNPIYKGDIAILEADGKVIAHQDGDTAESVGVVVGFADVGGYRGNLPIDHIKSNIAESYLTALTAGNVHIETDPDVVFVIETNGTIAESSKGSNADVVDGTPHAGSGRSGILLDTGSLGTGSTLPLLIVDRVVEAGNEWGVANPMKLLVKLNNHTNTGV